jgi:trigger factor
LDEKTPLPELDDEFVKTLGSYEGVADFKDKLRANIRAEKEREARDRVRIAIMEELVKESGIELPEIIIEQELHRMQDEFAHEVERMGLTWDAYMKAAGKTEEDMHREWREDAKKRAMTQLIASKISETEGLRPTDEEMEGEVKLLASRYPDADPVRIKGYVEMLLSNEKVFSFLEKAE